MSDEPFKLDALALARVRAESDAAADEHLISEILGELAGQLIDAGAPDAPLEEQLRALLASHRVLAEAGEEMPTLDHLVVTDVVPGQEVVVAGASIIRDLVTPILACRTQERNNLSALIEAERRTWADQVDALRQRAERAEWELAVERSAHSGARADASHLKTQLDAALARVAELESCPEPSADVVATLREAYQNGQTEEDEARPQKKNESFHEWCLRVEYAGIRAVLSALAAMGEEAWPSADDTASAIYERWDREGFSSGPWQDAVRATEETDALYRSRLAPVIAALRARVAKLEAGLREVVGEFRDALPYVPTYFREKYDYDATIAKADGMVGEAKA